MALWTAKIVTLFPDMFPGPLGVSVIGQALEKQIWDFETVDLRDFGHGVHRSVDDTPAGGGPGMVLRADVVSNALTCAKGEASELPTIYLSPRGVPFTQKRARELAAGPGVILLCGRFEGVDERVLEAHGVEEVCVGDFVLSGGEIPAMALIDGVVRLLPGVLGQEDSLSEESFEQGLLEYPHYTRPRVWEEREIPDVLLSGDHRRVSEWRREQAEKITKQRRPDLWESYKRSK